MIKKLILAFQVFLIGCDVGAIKTDAIALLSGLNR
jgi:hypothetical protein